MKKYTVVLASRNAHKVAELQKLLNELLGEVIDLKSLNDVGITEEIEENGTTFEENAMIKAAAAAKSGFIGLGDDSGLVVPALNMEPGIYSDTVTTLPTTRSCSKSWRESVTVRQHSFARCAACSPTAVPPFVPQAPWRARSCSTPEGRTALDTIRCSGTTLWARP